jgi:hypothetical protein
LLLLGCKYVAHKQCLDLLTISCQEQQGLRHSLPIYLLAHDKHEQKRWIRTIELHRKRAEAVMSNSNGNGSNGHSSLGRGGTPTTAAGDLDSSSLASTPASAAPHHNGADSVFRLPDVPSTAARAPIS